MYVYMFTFVSPRPMTTGETLMKVHRADSDRFGIAIVSAASSEADQHHVRVAIVAYRTLFVWDSKTGAKSKHRHTKEMTCVAFSPCETIGQRTPSPDGGLPGLAAKLPDLEEGMLLGVNAIGTV